MTSTFPMIYLVRHGETLWSLSGQHTGLTNLTLTERGERNARRIGERLMGKKFELILSSGLKRADRTCELAGFNATVQVDSDLVEWDYGDYEGLRSSEIHSERPDWQLFRDGCPAGESPQQVGLRADKVLSRIQASQGDVLLFSSGHFLRVLVARWVGLEPEAGRHFMLSTASLSLLGFEHDRTEPVIKFWNDTSHVEA